MIAKNSRPGTVNLRQPEKFCKVADWKIPKFTAASAFLPRLFINPVLRLVLETAHRYLWRAVDQERHVRDILVQSRRNRQAAKCSILGAHLFDSVR